MFVTSGPNLTRSNIYFRWMLNRFLESPMMNKQKRSEKEVTSECEHRSAWGSREMRRKKYIYYIFVGRGRIRLMIRWLVGSSFAYLFSRVGVTRSCGKSFQFATNSTTFIEKPNNPSPPKPSREFEMLFKPSGSPNSFNFDRSIALLQRWRQRRASIGRGQLENFLQDFRCQIIIRFDS